MNGRDDPLSFSSASAFSPVAEMPRSSDLERERRVRFLMMAELVNAL